MRLAKLNFGGIFGGLLCGVAAAAIIYLLSDGFPVRSIKIVALAAFAGATLGNWIWSLAAPAESQGFEFPSAASRERQENT